MLHPVRDVPEGPLHLPVVLLSSIQLGLGRDLSSLWRPPIDTSLFVGFPFLLRLRIGLVVFLLMQDHALGGALALRLVNWCPGPQAWDSVLVQLLGALGDLFLRLPFLRGNMFAQLSGVQNTTDEACGVRISIDSFLNTRSTS